MNRPWAEEYFQEVREKMVRGQEEHGDKSLTLKPSQVVAEMMEECVDISGWGAITWMRLRDLQRAIILAEELVTVDDPTDGEDEEHDEPNEEGPVVSEKV